MGISKKKLNKTQVYEILDKLEKLYPEAGCELNFNTPFQLLVATMLSAQSTDKSVNKVTDKLFQLYPEVDDFLSLTQAQLEEHIKSIGLYRTKSSNIIRMCKEIKTRFNGKVPDSMEDLLSLPGVGRKTANVVLSNAFGIPAIAVDTHVYRVSNRIGLATANDVGETEKQLMDAIPMEKWSKAHHLLIWHGRRMCMARNPKCTQCPLKPLCMFYNREKKKYLIKLKQYTLLKRILR